MGVQAKMSESDSDFGRSSDIFSDIFCTGHQLLKISRIFRPYGYMQHNSVNDIARCVSLYIHSDSQRCSEQSINVMSNHKYPDNFWAP